MTDDTGMLEHSLGRIPRRQEGYSTDDNARALWLCAVLGQYGVVEPFQEQLLPLCHRYLAFLLWAQTSDGRFRNNVNYNRTWEKEEFSEDCQGRSLWSLVMVLTRFRNSGEDRVAAVMLEKGLKPVANFHYLRGNAWALASMSLLLLHLRGTDNFDPETKSLLQYSTATHLPKLTEKLEEQLLSAYNRIASPQWSWFEPMLTYGNGVLPWSLLGSYQVTGHQEALEVGLSSLRFLLKQSTAPAGHIRPIGNRGWRTLQFGAVWDQQPLDVFKLALAAAKAYELTHDMDWWAVVDRCQQWFYGENDLGLPLANPTDGSCSDGLTDSGISLNRGAESTLAYLLTEALVVSLRVHAEAVRQ
ncbi:glycosyl transferase [Alicyclobacillaceae bacterium I2511]|nr:glycosyl transferase [Alicyclobacillaceae bacterium I2511]